MCDKDTEQIQIIAVRAVGGEHMVGEARPGAGKTLGCALSSLCQHSSHSSYLSKRCFCIGSALES